ncbi:MULTISPECIES: ATP-binding cassette domain-containing protein [Bacillus cereus group]|uniref:ATP-binding cassette domain-containing protein n=1 Tax=Bacillus cereus group TaxID=86661 RepID=UPI000BEC1EA8|nr:MULTISPECIES: ATP-binding cassette domain-containing protein [Bacillus cereus group]MCT6901924.1 ATP-binding cassette domain-containing protein [Lactobacillus sp.]MBJ7967055.1 ATP-binding cassette domain-containing protein [Bacillus cereus]MBJ8003424.1 ATP-binding cassette domain-containing protein [Bacillus cereus]MCU5407242.1 ATP-binding cassette domain-containing protein [Bacillus cereus]MCU5456305.1 ATP-binding cassette domain-containing protein [Bacillus cereus]
MNDNTVVVQVEGFSKKIKGNNILTNINLNLYKAKIYGFVGHNGSGKSMLFKAICGLTKGETGTITVNGNILGEKTDFPDRTGALIEHPGFLQQLSGFTNLKWLASIQNKISNEQIINAIQLVGLDPNDKRAVKKYSLGMKQRLGIAQAIMENPDILILDEPMNGLDSQGVSSIRNLLLQLKNKGVTILLASHIQEDIKLLCDEVFIMNNGEIVRE